jgi:orotidine-5'-phosphate decarboxylase
MMQAAVNEAKKHFEKAGQQTKLLGVTVLTALDEKDLESVGQKTPMLDQVKRLTELTLKSGMDGIVCAPHEIAPLRAAFGKDFLMVVPGIRPMGSDAGDQKRTMTPREAMDAGASYLVIGRPITQASDPVASVKQINSEF